MSSLKLDNKGRCQCGSCQDWRRRHGEAFPTSPGGEGSSESDDAAILSIFFIAGILAVCALAFVSGHETGQEMARQPATKSSTDFIMTPLPMTGSVKVSPGVWVQ